MIINIIFVTLLVILCIAHCGAILKKANNIYISILLISTLLLHFSFFIFHYNWGLTRDVDSKHFFDLANNSINWLSVFGIGNMSIPFIIYPFNKIGLSYFSVSFMFSIISFLGYLIYFKILTKNTSNKSITEKTITAIFFLIPSIHFWTVSVGKEAIIFLLMAIIFQKVYHDKINSLLIVFSVLIILFIRPYLAAILMFPIILLNFKKFSTTYKIIISTVTIVAVPIILRFLRISSFESIKTNYHKLALFARNNGDSSIDLLDSYYLERVFLVLFRPLFIDAKTEMQYYISIENLLWLIIFSIILLLLRNIRKAIKDFKFNFLLIYLFTIISFYGIYMYNLGLASRMRVLFIPYSILMLLILLKLEFKTKKQP